MMIRIAPKPAPPVTPITSGEASGLPSAPCRIAPATPSAAPTSSASTVRGSRRVSTICTSVGLPPLPKMMSITSEIGTLTAPKASEQTTAATSAATSAAKTRTRRAKPVSSSGRRRGPCGSCGRCRSPPAAASCRPRCRPARSGPPLVLDQAGFERRYSVSEGMSSSLACGTAMMMSGFSATTTSSEIRSKPELEVTPPVSSTPPALLTMSPPQLLGRKVNGVRPTPRISITLGRFLIPFSAASTCLRCCCRRSRA